MRWMVRCMVAVMLLAIAAWAQEPSLGEVARKKSDGPKAKRVITDEDMPERAREPVAASPTASGAPAAAAVPAASDSSKPTSSIQPLATTASNAEKIAFAEKMIERLKETEKVVSSRLNELERSLREEQMPDSRRQTYEETLRSQRDRLAELQKNRTEAEKAVAQFKAQNAAKK